jgi:hypothetical protein
MNLFSPKAVKGKYIVLKIIGGNNGEKKNLLCMKHQFRTTDDRSLKTKKADRSHT